MLAASWTLVSALNTSSEDFVAAKRAHNARVLLQAKQALIGYVAQKVYQPERNEGGGYTPKNPGHLPCPEAAASYTNTEEEGTANGNCTLPAVGRLPWKTLGLDKLVDADGEPLWYVVSPGWAYTSSTLVINSGTPGRLTVDGVANAAVALIVAPGPAMQVQAAAGCAARNQARNAASLNPLDYLECYSTASSSFVTTGPAASFNDAVLKVTTADVLPVIEAAIAQRIEREVAPVLASVYASATWGTSSANPAFPFPARFDDPDPGTSADFDGDIGRTQGLLPFSYRSSSCPAGDQRCSPPQTISWTTPSLAPSGGPGYFPSGYTPSCTATASTARCEGYYYGGALTLTMTDSTSSSITTGLRTLDVAAQAGSLRTLRWNGSSWVDSVTQAATLSRSLRSNGGVNFIARANAQSVPAWGYYIFDVGRPPSTAFGDHALLSASDPSTGWFVRNEWYRYVYYAIAPSHAPGTALSCSATGTITCLQVTNFTDPTKQRAILVLMGRALPSLAQTQPSGDLQNYLDNSENRNLDRIFVQSRIDASFNDRFISLSKNP